MLKKRGMEKKALLFVVLALVTIFILMSIVRHILKVLAT